MKTEKELEVLKVEYNSLKNKLLELSEDELRQVVGGNDYDMFKKEDGSEIFDIHVYKPTTDIEKKKDEFSFKG